jgi:hypothetical protein
MAHAAIPSSPMLPMIYVDVLWAGLAALVMAILVCLGLMAATKEKLTTADCDTVALASLVTFVSTIVAQNRGWMP